jgi:hypothetical protein
MEYTPITSIMAAREPINVTNSGLIAVPFLVIVLFLSRIP